MIKHIWSILCKESTINQDNNNISLRDVLESLHIELTPKDKRKHVSNPSISLPIGYEIVSFLTRDTEEINETTIKITILNPKGAEINTNQNIIKFPEKVRRMRARYKVNGLDIQYPGDYVFKIELKEDNTDKFTTVAEIPLEVSITLIDSKNNYSN